MTTFIRHMWPILAVFINFKLFRKLLSAYNLRGAQGSVVGSGTMLQAGRSPVRVPDEVDFFNLPNPGIDSASNRNDYQESFWG
jgi:hypothetical protein